MNSKSFLAAMVILLPFPFFASIHFLDYWLSIPFCMAIFMYWAGSIICIQEKNNDSQ